MQKYKTADEFLNDLEADKRIQVEAIRQIILNLNAGLEEHIKWNAPSYIYEGEDRITFNLINKEDVVKLVIHMGSTRKEDKNAAPIVNDTTGLVVWSSDIRGLISFQDIDDVHAKSKQLDQVLTQWLAVKH